MSIDVATQAQERLERGEVERLYLSGGSNRAALGSLGAIAYLLQSNRWRQVEEVVSVSGGSFLNGALIAAGAADTSGCSDRNDHWAADDDHTWRVLADFIGRVENDRLRPWATGRRLLISLLIVTSVVVIPVGLVGSALGLFGPEFASRAPWAVLAGVMAVASASAGARHGFAAQIEDYVSTVTLGDGKQLHNPSMRRAHIMCATGLSTGQPYYFVGGGADGLDVARAVDPHWGTAVSDGQSYDVTDAVCASASLPGSERINSPSDARFGREKLIDGGSSGNFGQQFSEPLMRTPDTVGAGMKREFGLDAGIPIKPMSGIYRFLGRFTFVFRAVRWIQVHNEALYANDLNDIGRGRIAQICSTAHLDRTGNVRDGLGRQIETHRSPCEMRLDELRRRCAGLGQTNLNLLSLSEAVACGVLATAETLDGQLTEDDARELLGNVGRELDLRSPVGDATFEERLTTVWDSTASMLFFELQQQPFAVSHGGVARQRRRYAPLSRSTNAATGSVDAFTHAYEDGFRCLQVDVVVGPENQLVSHHSYFGRSRRIRSLPPDQLGLNSATPSLAALFDHVDREDVFWNVEFKHREVLAPLVSFLNDRSDLHRFCVSAPFNPRALRDLREQLPQLATNEALVEGAAVGVSIRPRRGMETNASGVQLHRWIAAAPIVSTRKAKQGRVVQAWVVNSTIEAKKLESRGTKGLITDEPQCAKDIEKGRPLRRFEWPGVSLVRATSCQRNAQMWGDLDPSVETPSLLLVSSTPRQAAVARVGAEFRNARRVLTGENGQVAIHELSHATPETVHGEIKRLGPTVLHFAGHGTGRDGPLLQNDAGDVVAVEPGALADSLDAAGTRTAVFTACNADPVAQELAQRGIPVVAPIGDLTDEQAADFATKLYEDSVAYTESSVRSFAFAALDSPWIKYASGSPIDDSSASAALVTRNVNGLLRPITEQDGVWWEFKPGFRNSIYAFAPPPVGARSFTVVAWVRRDVDAEGNGFFADSRTPMDSAGSEGGWAMGFYQGRHLLFQMNPKNAAGDIYKYWDASSPNLSDGRWHFVAASVDRSEGGMTTLFVDGQLHHQDVTRFTGEPVTGHALLVGTNADAVEGRSKTNDFGGEVGSLGVLYRAMCPAEIADHFTQTQEQYLGSPAGCARASEKETARV